MIFYEVLGTPAAPCCLVGTQADAKALARERGTSFEQVDVPTDKPGLMAYINALKAGVSAEMHRDDDAGSVPIPVGVESQDSYIHQSVDLDEQFEKLPLARQLHFAALAMENARERV